MEVPLHLEHWKKSYYGISVKKVGFGHMTYDEVYDAKRTVLRKLYQSIALRKLSRAWYLRKHRSLRAYEILYVLL